MKWLPMVVATGILKRKMLFHQKVFWRNSQESPYTVFASPGCFLPTRRLWLIVAICIMLRSILLSFPAGMYIFQYLAFRFLNVGFCKFLRLLHLYCGSLFSGTPFMYSHSNYIKHFVIGLFATTNSLTPISILGNLPLLKNTKIGRCLLSSAAPPARICAPVCNV